MICDTRYADGNVYFHEDFFEFKARDSRFSSYDVQIRYEDITNIETYMGIKKTVVIVTKDGNRHYFYMYKMNTFVALVNAGRNKDVVTYDATEEASETKKEISSEDLEKLSQLNNLHKDGVLSDEEFESQKDIIMEKYR